ncbi:hypothetical protein [uncultured Alteromonas sp.]|uniref:hypothetical protein n=1 Tax=uncultured Alteromonas sp. TaxID=179113 RepID=UPI0030D30EB3
MSNTLTDYTNKEMLVKVMAGLGTIVEHPPRHPEETQSSSDKDGLVLINPSDSDERIVFKRKRGIWRQEQIDSNIAGTWTTSVSKAIERRYWIFEEQQKIQEAGWETGIAELEDGTLEVHAFPKWTRPKRRNFH